MATVAQMLESPMCIKLPPPVELTARQVEVLTLLACGKSNKEVANELFISIKTVQTHRTMIYEALDIHNSVSLALYAIREGFVRVI
jgi:NarL family two-component system response regulator LiaR